MSFWGILRIIVVISVDLSSHKIITCRHIYFDESKFPFAKVHESKPTDYEFLDSGFSPYMIHHLQHPSSQSPTAQPTSLSPPTAQPAETAQPTPPTPLSHDPVFTKSAHTA